MFTELCISEDEQTVKHWLSAVSLQSTANVCSPSKAADFQRVRLTEDYVSWSESVPLR